MIPFLVFITCMFCVFGAYLLATRGTEVKRKRLQQRLSDALLYSKRSDDEEVQLARAELMSEIPALSRFLICVQGATSLRRDVHPAAPDAPRRGGGSARPRGADERDPRAQPLPDARAGGDLLAADARPGRPAHHG